MLLLVACGRTDIRSASGAGGSLPTVDPCAPHGVRLCSEPECPLAVGACPGIGCTPAADRDTGVSDPDVGVCWLDIPTFLTEVCNGCDDGEVCLHRSPDELVCVPWEVCDSLYHFSAESVCRYADKSPFDDRPLAIGTCPAAAKEKLCGGGCGGCPKDGGEYRCTGRSADRPHGICVRVIGPTVFSPCSFGPAGDVLQACFHDDLCAVFDVAPPADVVARRFGVCLPKEDCLAKAALTPLHCFDQAGDDKAF